MLLVPFCVVSTGPVRTPAARAGAERHQGTPHRATGTARTCGESHMVRVVQVEGWSQDQPDDDPIRVTSSINSTG